MAGVQLCPAEFAYLFNRLLGELHLRLPDAFDLFLYFLHRDIRQVAVGAPGVSPEAEEVAVDTTLAP
ncbi:hypothetical protein [Rhodoglobus vestalii]|uniref:hypothetical protein n=1 Tax=Rhodoglobus vestalii TaxID=193384 RepID=UPI001FE39AAD|nr:hypothetical protein [Rhodoglobus vestalii]